MYNEYMSNEFSRRRQYNIILNDSTYKYSILHDKIILTSKRIR